MDTHTTELLERGVAALEKIAAEPKIEIDPGPPLCPHCGAFDPEVVIEPDEGQGKLSEWVLVAACGECGQRFYGNVESWSMHRSPETVAEEIRERNARAENDGIQ